MRNKILWSAALLGFFMLLVYIWSNTPIVYRSAKTNECVRVWTPDGDGSCGDLPEKYELVWVE